MKIIALTLLCVSFATAAQAAPLIEQNVKPYTGKPVNVPAVEATPSNIPGRRPPDPATRFRDPLVTPVEKPDRRDASGNRRIPMQ